MFSRFRRFVFVAVAMLIGALLSHGARAYVLNGYRWPDGTNITMHLQLNGPSISFQDGSASWNASAADALVIWNQYINTVHFTVGTPTTQAPNDGINSVFFSNTIYGETFGPRVLAFTIYFPQSGGGIFTETDVIFNTAVKFDSYRGPLQHVGNTYTYDLHRVALHEFGHVLGLDHPDQEGQIVSAVMNSITSDLDHLAPDDIAGARFLYPSPPVNFTTGEQANYQVSSTISGGTFSATNLPPGLGINSVTGLIAGIPTISGTYLVAITVSGTGGSQTFNLTINVTAPPSAGVLGTLLKTLPLDVAQLTPDPLRDRVYATLPSANSVAVISANSYTVIKTIPVGSNPYGLSVSVDGSKLWVANRDSFSPAISVIDLETLTALPGLPAPESVSDVEEGLDGRLYCSGSRPSSFLLQLNTRPGEFHGNFSVGGFSDPGFLEMSPDRRTLFYAAQGGGTLMTFDVSTSTPQPLQTKDASSNGQDLALSHNGLFLVFPGGGGNPGAPSYSTNKVRTNDINLVTGSFAVHGYPGPACFGADDTILYHAAHAPSGVQLFDTGNFAPIGEIQASDAEVQDITVDRSGAALYVATLPYPSPGELRIYATGRNNGAAPTATPKPKSLVNVATRLRSESGDNVLIAGFIITGSQPKKVALRGIGPSLPVPGSLADPIVELHAASGALIASNDNWNSHRTEVLTSGLMPTNEYESVIISTLQPGSYTAVLKGAAGTTGVALVELFDLSPESNSRIANISTRGKVETGDNVMIGGFIIGGNQPTKVIVKAVGPSLTDRGVAGALADTTLELHNGNGVLFASNDDWQSDQAAEITASAVAPTDPRESAIVRTLQPGNYTAIVRGKNETTGVALVEVYNLEPN